MSLHTIPLNACSSLFQVLSTLSSTSAHHYRPPAQATAWIHSESRIERSDCEGHPITSGLSSWYPRRSICGPSGTA